MIQRFEGLPRHLGPCWFYMFLVMSSGILCRFVQHVRWFVVGVLRKCCNWFCVCVVICCDVFMFLMLCYVVFVFVFCLICVCCCLLNMCRAVFVPIRSVMDVRMHVIISLRHRCSNSRYCFSDFVWCHCFPLANHIRSTRKLLIALTFIRVNQHCMHWMKQFVVVCVFHHKLINMEYKDLSK